MHSLISQFNTGHLEPTWFVRLKAKPVFVNLWQTSKLLTSIDAIAIGRPPENGEESFAEINKGWLHLDQNASRVGLHAVQGGVYLEETCEDDWTLEVLEGSHCYFDEFFEGRQDAARISEFNTFYMMTEDDVKFYGGKGCQKIRVSVPKGGMVLWDSRLVHANARPRKDRDHPGRWRYVVFVSMTPAHWASETDMNKKKYAYNNVVMTTHWSSQGVKTHGSGLSVSGLPTKIPEIATTNEAKELAGIVPYDFEDGISNGPQKPTWKVS
ncbi:hypothetical protein ACJMK2_006191 [Sinanodonta woodiana]|uniref:Phytanoyl-CoA dioxygenase n=1 Tax=Sinanodonta woodiana TaxID=1069815 RepID=A0ABD3VVJ5_SINWO